MFLGKSDHGESHLARRLPFGPMIACCALVAGLVAAPGLAHPQTVETDWGNVEALAAGSEVRVFPVLGSQRVEVRSPGTARFRPLRVTPGRRIEIRGAMVEANSAEIIVTPPAYGTEEWIVRREDVDRILKVETERDSARNGILIGAAAGAGSWLVLGAGDHDLDALSWEGLLITTGLGAFIGGIADDVQHTEREVLVYRAPPPANPQGPALETAAAPWCWPRLHPAAPIGAAGDVRTPTLREDFCREVARIVIESDRESRR